MRERPQTLRRASPVTGCAKIVINDNDFSAISSTAMLLPRLLTQRLPGPPSHRLVMITGARQTGKTTLARSAYPGLRYVTLDEIEERIRLRNIPTRAWASTVGAAILDEAQKEPALFEKVKFAFDKKEIDFTVLLGSSQILMLERVRETLAGRVFVYELWPLTLSELTASGGHSARPLFDRLLTAGGNADDVLGGEPVVQLGEEAHRSASSYGYALQWGGMPALLELTDAEVDQSYRSLRGVLLKRALRWKRRATR